MEPHHPFAEPAGGPEPSGLRSPASGPAADTGTNCMRLAPSSMLAPGDASSW